MSFARIEKVAIHIESAPGDRLGWLFYADDIYGVEPADAAAPFAPSLFDYLEAVRALIDREVLGMDGVLRFYEDQAALLPPIDTPGMVVGVWGVSALAGFNGIPGAVMDGSIVDLVPAFDLPVFIDPPYGTRPSQRDL